MARFVFAVLTNPVEGREDEFNAWYDEVHLPDVLGVDGVVSAQRFRYHDTAEKASPWRYLALYEWEADSVEDARASLDRAREAGRVPLHPSLDPAHTAAWFFEPITERRTAAGE
jgi:hypothetical protein